MIVHGYDVGVRHLALCVLKVWRDASVSRGVRCEVLQWEILDCATAAHAEDLNLNKTKIDGIVEICATAWGKLEGRMIRTDPWPDAVYIELQPKTLNNKMQVVSYCLQAFLLSHFASEAEKRKLDTPRFSFVDADLKLQEADFTEYWETSFVAQARKEGRKPTRIDKSRDRDRKYALNKAHAKKISPELLRESGDETHAAWFESQGGKRDDLADAFLMAFYRAREELLGITRTARRRGGPKKKVAPSKASTPKKTPARGKRARATTARDTVEIESINHGELADQPAKRVRKPANQAGKKGVGVPELAVPAFLANAASKTPSTTRPMA